MLPIEQGSSTFSTAVVRARRLKLWKTKPSLRCEGGEFIARESGNVDAVEQVAAAASAGRGSRAVHERRFAGAARAHDGDKLAARISSETLRTAWTSISPLW